LYYNALLLLGVFRSCLGHNDWRFEHVQWELNVIVLSFEAHSQRFTFIKTSCDKSAPLFLYTWQWRTRDFFFFSWGQRERESGDGSSLVRGSAQFVWVKPVFLLGCYECIFHGTGNSAQLCQNFRISGGGGRVLTPQTPPSVRHWSLVQLITRLSLFVVNYTNKASLLSCYSHFSVFLSSFHYFRFSCEALAEHFPSDITISSTANLILFCNFLHSFSFIHHLYGFKFSFRRKGWLLFSFDMFMKNATVFVNFHRENKLQMHMHNCSQQQKHTNAAKNCCLHKVHTMKM
jgi:hypothetical protein